MEEIIKQLLELKQPLTIQYTNVNGEEKLIVNGQEIRPKFDDSEVKQMVVKYKTILDRIDDCVFLEVLEEIGEDINLNEFDALLQQDNYTSEESDKLLDMIHFAQNTIAECVSSKITDYQRVLEMI